MLAAQSSTVRGADGSVMQVVDLSAPIDEGGNYDGAARIRFLTEDSLGMIRPGNSYRLTLEDLGRVLPTADEVPGEAEVVEQGTGVPVVDATVAVDPQQVQVTTDPTPEAAPVETQSFVVAEGEPDSEVAPDVAVTDEAPTPILNG